MNRIIPIISIKLTFALLHQGEQHLILIIAAFTTVGSGSLGQACKGGQSMPRLTMYGKVDNSMAEGDTPVGSGPWPARCGKHVKVDKARQVRQSMPRLIKQAKADTVQKRVTHQRVAACDQLDEAKSQRPHV